MPAMTYQTDPGFSSSLEIEVLIYKPGQEPQEWREIGRGPGFFTAPEGWHLMVRARNIDDRGLKDIVQELADARRVTYLFLAENRKITDTGLALLPSLPWLEGLNLSSCSIRDQGLSELTTLRALTTLNLSFCNRITDAGLKHLQQLRNLEFLDLLGCIKTTRKGVAMLERRGLTIRS